MNEVPFYQILDFPDVFQNSIIKKQVDLVKRTCLKPLSYFNTLPSGDFVSDAEFDTFLSDQMFQEEFEFTVADDMSIGKTTLRNSIGKIEALNFNFHRSEAASAPGQARLKKLNTFHLGDRNIIPCSTGDNYSKDGMDKESGVSSRASFWNDSLNPVFQSLRKIEDELPSPHNELMSPSHKELPSKNFNLAMPNETPNFGSFLKKPASNKRMVSQGDQTYIIEETNEEISNKSQLQFSSQNSKNISQSGSKSHSHEKKGNKIQENNSQEVKKKLINLSGISRSDNCVRLSKSSHEAKDTSNGQISTKVLYQADETTSRYSSDPQLNEIKTHPLTLLDLERDRLSEAIFKDLKKKRTESEAGNAKVSDSTTKGQQLFNSHGTNSSMAGDKLMSPQPTISRQFSIGNPQSDLLEPTLVLQFEQRFSATCATSPPIFGDDILLEKKLSDIDKKILAVRMKTQMLDLAYKKAKEEQEKVKPNESKPSGQLSLDAIHEYRQLDSMPSTLKNTPKKVGTQSSEANPFFQSVSKLTATIKDKGQIEGITPSFQFSRDPFQDRRHEDQISTIVAKDFSKALEEAIIKSGDSPASKRLLKADTNKSLDTDNSKEFGPLILSSPQRHKLRKIVGLKKGSEFNIRRKVIEEEPLVHIPLSASISKASENQDKGDSISASPLTKENEAFFTSRDKSSSKLDLGCQTRLSAHSHYKEKEKEKPKQITTTRKAMFSFHALKSKLGSHHETPQKRSFLDVLDKKSSFKLPITEFKSRSFLESLEFRHKTISDQRTGDPVLGHKPQKSIKMGNLLAATKPLSQKKTLGTKDEDKLKGKLLNEKMNYKDLKSKLFQLLGPQNKADK